MSGGSVGEEHERGRCGPCAECRAASRPAPGVALGDLLFKVYVDGAGRTARPVAADNALEAAESYWRRRVLRGETIMARGAGEAIVVEHPRGPEVDPSVTWHQDDEGGAPFAVFVVRVVDVQVSAEVAP